MKKSILSLVALLALGTTAYAGDVKVSGFMNVVAGMSDLDPDDATTSSSYMGYDDQYDFQKDSLAAIQFSGTIADNMGATVQIIGQKRDVKDDLRMEWGYAYYDATDEVRILAGLIRPSLFLYSDYIDVGYAYVWITPPDEVYSQANISNMNGVSATYNLELGDNTFTTTLYGGNASDEKANPLVPGSNLDFSFDNIIGGEISLSNDYGKLRAGIISADVTENNYFTATNVPAELVMDKNQAIFYSIGLSVDYEDFIFASEYISRDLDESVTSDVETYYAMVGYKIGDFTPNYTYASVDSSIDMSTDPDPLNAAKVNAMRAGKLDDRTSNTLGVRYDLNTQAALKFEYSATTVTHSSYDGATGKIVENDEDISLYRIALNVIF